MIIAGPGIAPGTCDTPVDLLDLFPTILQGAGIDPTSEMEDRPGRSLQDIAMSPVEPERVILSEYHAAGSNSAGFMLRKGRYKFLYYVRHDPELYDLLADPEELTNLATDTNYKNVMIDLERELRQICDPEAMDALAKLDQKALIERLGGVQAASQMGAAGATPSPIAA
jgi:choline-sulfatase